MGFKLRFEKPFIKDNTERTTKAEVDILLNAQKIALKVEKQTFDALEDSVEDQWAELAVQAMLVSSKVSETDYNGNTIASLINQAANEVKIQANKITLEGLITANQNFKILADGSIEAKNAKLTGSITATRMQAPPGVVPGYDPYTGENYYGEVGVTSNSVGFGLYDLKFRTQAYFQAVELLQGTGFALKDYNDVQRFSVSPALSAIRDASGVSRFSATNTSTNLRDQNSKNIVQSNGTNVFLQSPDGQTYVAINNGSVSVVVNGVVKVQWI